MPWLMPNRGRLDATRVAHVLAHLARSNVPFMSGRSLDRAPVFWAVRVGQRCGRGRWRCSSRLGSSPAACSRRSPRRGPCACGCRASARRVRRAPLRMHRSSIGDPHATVPSTTGGRRPSRLLGSDCRTSIFIRQNVGSTLVAPTCADRPRRCSATRRWGAASMVVVRSCCVRRPVPQLEPSACARRHIGVTAQSQCCRFLTIS